MQILIADIKIGDRQRELYGDIDELAASMKDPRFGQLQPILLDRDNTLIAGGRRLAAAMKLGWTHIAAEYKDSISPIHAKEMELEENLKRKDLEFGEKQRAIAEIDELKRKLDPTWTLDKSAELLKVSKRTISNAKEITDAISRFNAGDMRYEDVAKADTQTGAMQRLQRLKNIEARMIDAQAKQLYGDTKLRDWEIITGDAREWLRVQADASLDVMVMNPPYGVDIEKVFVSDKRIYGEDDPSVMSELCRDLVNLAYQKLKPDRWLVVFWPTAYLDDLKGVSPTMRQRLAIRLGSTLQKVGMPPETIATVFNALDDVLSGFLTSAGFTFQQVPCVWYKTEGKFLSSISDPGAMLNGVYETFYLARKGDAKLQQIHFGNVFAHATVPAAQRVHPLEMSDELWEQILRVVAQPGETVVEPCCGSGRCGLAALRLGMKYLGIEKDEQWAKRARMLLTEGPPMSGIATMILSDPDPVHSPVIQRLQPVITNDIEI